MQLELSSTTCYCSLQRDLGKVDADDVGRGRGVQGTSGIGRLSDALAWKGAGQACVTTQKVRTPCGAAVGSMVRMAASPCECPTHVASCGGIWAKWLQTMWAETGGSGGSVASDVWVRHWLGGVRVRRVTTQKARKPRGARLIVRLAAPPYDCPKKGLVWLRQDCPWHDSSCKFPGLPYLISVHILLYYYTRATHLQH